MNERKSNVRHTEKIILLRMTTMATDRKTWSVSQDNIKNFESCALDSRPSMPGRSSAVCAGCPVGGVQE